jgi:hypothetical protein
MDAVKSVCSDLIEKAEWDGVENSYLYTDVEEYNALRVEYKSKKQKDTEKRGKINALIHSEIQKFFAHHSTRRVYGLPVKKTDWQDACKRAQDDCKKFNFELSVDVSLLLNLYGLLDFVKTERVKWAIEKNLPQGWNQYYFNEK